MNSNHIVDYTVKAFSLKLYTNPLMKEVLFVTDAILVKLIRVNRLKLYQCSDCSLKDLLSLVLSNTR